MLDFSRFKILTFDCYGTLIHWEDGILRCLHRILAAHGKDKDTCEHVAEVILKEWRGFRGLYRGTGARYVTMGRLGRWLARAIA